MSEHWCGVHKTKFFKTEKMKSYAHPVKDAEGNTSGWCNEEATSQAAPTERHEPEKPFEPAINQQKQASIESQNARTNLTNLAVAGRLDEGLEHALISQLCSFAGLLFDGTYKEKGGHVVEAAKQMGAVDRPVKTLGELREKIKALGVTDEVEQKRVCGLEGSEPWSNLKGNYVGAYLIAKETISPATTG